MDQLTDRERDGVAKLRRRYADIATPLFDRSVSRASTLTELFDILDTMPPKLPVVWNPGTRRWKAVADILAQRRAEE